MAVVLSGPAASSVSGTLRDQKREQPTTQFSITNRFDLRTAESSRRETCGDGEESSAIADSPNLSIVKAVKVV